MPFSKIEGNFIPRVVMNQDSPTWPGNLTRSNNRSKPTEQSCSDAQDKTPHLSQKIRGREGRPQLTSHKYVPKSNSFSFIF